MEPFDFVFGEGPYGPAQCMARDIWLNRLGGRNPAHQCINPSEQRRLRPAYSRCANQIVVATNILPHLNSSHVDPSAMLRRMSLGSFSSIGASFRSLTRSQRHA